MYIRISMWYIYTHIDIYIYIHIHTHFFLSIERESLSFVKCHPPKNWLPPELRRQSCSRRLGSTTDMISRPGRMWRHTSHWHTLKAENFLESSGRFARKKWYLFYVYSLGVSGQSIGNKHDFFSNFGECYWKQLIDNNNRNLLQQPNQRL